MALKKGEQSRHVTHDPSTVEKGTPSESNSYLDATDEPAYNVWRQAPVFLAMGLGIFILGLDNTIMGPTSPTISNEFNALTEIGWFGASYRLALCSAQFFYGKIYHQFPVKWVLVTAVAILEVGSIVSATAPTSVAFIIGRVISGYGASGILNGVVIAISHIVPLCYRPIFNSTVGGLECIAMIVAPVVGGALTTYINWRWCFWINLPIGGFALIVIVLLFKNPPNQKLSDDLTAMKIKQLNIPSLLVLTASIVCLLLALQWGGTTYPWGSSRVIATLVLAAVFFVGFAIIESIQDVQTIPTAILFNRTAVLRLVYSFLASAAFNVIDYYLPIWFQAIHGANAAISGRDLLPSIISLSVTAITSGFILAAIGYYAPFMALGSILTAIGFGFFANFSLGTKESEWIGWQVMAGIGIRLSIPQPWSAIQTALKAPGIPLGMAGIGLSISMGAAISIAVCQNVFTNFLRRKLTQVPNLNVDEILRQGATSLLHDVSTSQRHHVLSLYNAAVTKTFWVGVAAADLSLISAMCMQWNSIKTKKTEA